MSTLLKFGQVNSSRLGARGDLVRKISKLSQIALNKGIDRELVREAFLHLHNKANVSQLLKDCNDERDGGHRFLSTKTVSAAVIVVGILNVVLASCIFNTAYMEHISQHKCALKSYEYIHEIFRPVFNCSVCSSLTSVPVERNISVEDFKTKYAYTTVPVIIKEATTNWTALTVYSFQFFKDLYLRTSGSLMYREDGCLSFMPWCSNINSLDEFFNMSDARANLEEGEEHWYIGWMNCKKEIQTVLRQHYKRPYFLPNDTESSVVNWIFMGGPGPGVTLHVDKINRPSWQAQISGTKTWKLVPVPECAHTCHTLDFTVNKGDILVFHGNHWYHTTKVEPGEISISIGSEYD